VNFLVGAIGLALTVAWAVSADQTRAIGGLLHLPALVLVGIGPLFIACASFKLEELVLAVREAGRSLRFSARGSRALLFEELETFAQHVRGRRLGQALAAADGARHDLLRRLAPLVIRQYAPEQIERTAAAAAWCAASERKRCEDVLGSLARIAPAVGLVGTTLGLISLLRDLRSFDHLGPAMALALLCTFYGLLAANALWQPLARLVHHRSSALSEEARLLTRALLLVAEGKPLADVRGLFEDVHAAAAGPDAIVEPAP
jgi:chemotaxis protein MotA